MTRRDALVNRLGALERAAGVVSPADAQRALLASLPTETLEELERLLTGSAGVDPGETLAQAIARLTGPESRRRAPLGRINTKSGLVYV